MNKALRKSKDDVKSGRRTETKEVRRSQLIDATIDSIAQYGIGGTTMSTVTEIAGLSIGIVNFHFESKQKLFEQTLVTLAQEHHAQWYKAFNNAGLTASEKLLAIVDAHFHPKICSRKKLAVWFAFYGEAGRRAVYRSLIDQIDDERYDLSTQLCSEIIEEGGYRGAPPAIVARTLEGLYDGFFLNLLMYPDEFKRDDARTQVHVYLATVFPQHFEMPPC